MCDASALPTSAARLILLALATLALLGGCGDSADEDRGAFGPVFDEIEGLNAGERERKLRDLAREEGGELTFYTSYDQPTQRAIAAEFQRRFGVKVTVFRADSEAVAQRVSQEAKANRRGADVADLGGIELVGLDRQGALVPYEPSRLGSLVPGAQHPGWTASRFQKFVVAWNTRFVPAGEEPPTIEDLADPRWKGTIGIEANDADWYKALRDHWVASGKTEAEADRLLKGIVANARPVNGHSLVLELLAAGEIAATPTAYVYQVREAAADGAPVAFQPVVEPVITRANGVALLETADDPASAVLFLEWLLGEGQDLLARNHNDPARAGPSSLKAEEVPIDVDAFADEARLWKDRYDALLRGAEAPAG